MKPFSLISRRDALKSLSSGFGYLAFAALAHGAAAKDGAPAARLTHFAPRAKRVIFLCMRGGPSHVDLFDHKPELIKRSGEAASLSRDAVEIGRASCRERV